MQSPSKVAPVCELQGWEDLPQGLFHSIIPLLGSLLDLLAFASSCHTWRAAFSSYPLKSALRASFPPLLVQPNVRLRAPYVPSNHGAHSHRLYKCQATDPANLKTALRCHIPEEMYLVGSSYGQLICARGLGCLIVDVFTGARISPPYLPLTDDIDFCCGMLTDPLTSPDSHLLVCAKCHDSLYGSQCYLLDWPVGGRVWSVHQLNRKRIDQIVKFQGKLIAMDRDQRIYFLSLEPKLGLQEILSEQQYSIPKPWLVVCGYALLMVDLNTNAYPSFKGVVNYMVCRLDMSTKPAAWVVVDNLDDIALFVGGAVRSPFSCQQPGRWGGRSNCLYCNHNNNRLSLPWIVCGLDGCLLDDSTNPVSVFQSDRYSQLMEFWVYPSMFYSDGLARTQSSVPRRESR